MSPRPPRRRRTIKRTPGAGQIAFLVVEENGRLAILDGLPEGGALLTFSSLFTAQQGMVGLALGEILITEVTVHGIGNIMARCGEAGVRLFVHDFGTAHYVGSPEPIEGLVRFAASGNTKADSQGTAGHDNLPPKGEDQ